MTTGKRANWPEDVWQADQVFEVTQQEGGRVYACQESRCRLAVLHAHAKRPYLVWRNKDKDKEVNLWR